MICLSFSTKSIADENYELELYEIININLKWVIYALRGLY